MCMNCWIGHGSPKIDTPAVREVVNLVNQIYHYSGVGSNLHVIIDDFNIEDRFFEEEMYGCVLDNLHDSTDEQIDLERRCYLAMKALTQDERASALYFQMTDG